MIRIAVLAVTIWVALIYGGAPQQAPTQPIVLDVPPFVTGLHATNPQIIRDRAGVIWAATRDNSSVGGIVWRVDGYVDEHHRGTATQVFPTDPRRFFANGELIVYPDGYLWYITVEVNNLTERRGIAQVAWPVPGWTP